MAVVITPGVIGDVSVRAVTPAIMDTMPVAIAIGQATAFLTLDEAVKLYNSLDDMLEQLGCALVIVEVSDDLVDETEGATP